MTNKKHDKSKIKISAIIKEKSLSETNSTSLLISIGAILLLIIIAYYPSLQCGFTNWDDQLYVTDSGLIKSLSFENIKKIFSTESIVALNYHPLTILSLAIDYHFAKLNPERYHLINLLLHLINTVLVFFLVYRLSGKKIIAAIIVSLFFGIHPMHIESVTWVAERKDVLYTLFFISALLTYLTYLKTNKNKFIFLTFTLFVFSVLSKAMAVVLPFILFLIDYFNNRKVNQKVFLEKIPFLIVSLIFGIFAIRVQAHDAIGSYQSFSLFHRIEIGFYGFFTYIWKMFLPVNLSSFHPYPPVANGWYPFSFYASAICGVVIFIFTVFLFLRRKKEYRYLSFGIGFYFITIVLVLQFLSVGKTIIAERYSYVSYIGLLFILGTFLNDLIEKHPSYKLIITIAVCSVALIFSGVTFERNHVWKNAGTLWSNVIERYPYPEYFVENAYVARGNFRAAESNDFNGALEDYDILLQNNTTHPEIYYNLGYVCGIKGNIIYKSGDSLKAMELFNKSIEYFSKSVELDSNSFKTFKNRATTYIFMKKYDLAALDFDKTLKIEPGNLDMLEKRAYAYNMSDQWEKAIADYDNLIAITPNNGFLYLNRGKAKYNIKNYKDAINDFNKFVQFQPLNGNTYYLLASCYDRLGDRINVLANIEKAKQSGFDVDLNGVEKFTNDELNKMQ